MNKSQKVILINTLIGSLGSLAVWLYFKSRYSFAQEWVFWFLLIIPLLGVYDLFNSERKFPRVQLSSLTQFGKNTGIFGDLIIPLNYLLRVFGLCFLVIALARPQSELSWKNVTTEGIDIVVAMDISVSMLAQDFDPNRLASAKEVAIDFIENRPNDRMGLVVYEGESFTQCPLTTDHNVLINLFKDIRPGMVEGGTAIGMGLATAVNRLKESEAKSKVIILLTDGDNNAGAISPTTAAEIAQSFGIRVYTIGVGSKGKAKSPVAVYPDGRYKYDYVDVRIDEKSLQEIADMTGGKYFRATNSGALKDIYQEIDLLEKTKINVTEHSRKSEEFFLFAVIGASLIFLQFGFKELIAQTLP